MRSSLLIVIALTLTGCSSTHLVSEWQNPDLAGYSTAKVLILGITADTLIRRSFEERLALSLNRQGVAATPSIDRDGMLGDGTDLTQTYLEELEQELLEEGYDAILVSKVTGQEQRKSMVQSARGLMNEFQTFSDYYSSNQEVYQYSKSQNYRVYLAESSIFCICPGEDPNLVWRARIDIVDPYRNKRNIRDYIRTLTKTLRERKLIPPR